MSATAIIQVTRAFRDRLTVALTKSGIAGTVFVGPLDDADASGAALILFLYRVVPNPSLRNREHIVANPSPSLPTVFRNSLPLDLYYLVTVGTVAAESEDRFLQALGFAMREIQNNPDLTGPDVEFQTVHLSLEPLTTEESSRIWALFPSANYRTSIAYLATPVWIDPEQPPLDAGLVVQDQLRAGVKSLEGV
ncbi:MAG TPA: DUF4255 domain-containing protein [Pyrinomonadaceae bacterium]|nr:DUF4255 domain-containing protein [Pyrinomonadaceae bacterium]